MVTQKMIHSVLQLKSVVGVQSYFSGSTWLGQIPKFFQKLDLKASLIFQTKNYEKRSGMRDLEIHNVLLLFPCSRSPHFCFTGQHRKVKSKVKKLKCVAQYVIM